MPAHFDTALVIENSKLHKLQSGLQGMLFLCALWHVVSLSFLPGLCAACVHVIFDLPRHLGGMDGQRLAYIHWYRPFHAQEQHSGYHILAPSTRNHHPHAMIVPVTSILCSCHLIPNYGLPPLNSSWTADSILDEPIDFLFNAHIDFHMFEEIASCGNGHPTCDPSASRGNDRLEGVT